MKREFVSDRSGRDVGAGDVVQIDPAHDPVFGGCIAIVDDCYNWGIQGHVVVPHQGSSARAYVRVPSMQFSLIGNSVWIYDDEKKDWVRNAIL
jgi:hypothetical protein